MGVGGGGIGDRGKWVGDGDSPFDKAVFCFEKEVVNKRETADGYAPGK